MASEHRGAGLRHLHTVLSAGAVGALGDGPLLERFLAGRGDADSSAAFAALVERHGPMVLRVCRDVLGDLHDAEDAAQATFLVLARSARSIRRIDSLASWLFGVARRVATKAKARNIRGRIIERRGAEVKAGTTSDTSRRDGWPELHEELDRLPERYRAPIALCHLEGLSNEQAAFQLGLPLRTVQRRLAQGRERLRARLARRGWESAVGLLATPGFATDPVSEAWLEATVKAAAGLATGRAMAALASVTVTAMTKGVLTMMLVGRLKAISLGPIAACAVIAAVVGAGTAIVAKRDDEPTARQPEAEPAAALPLATAGPWIKGVVVDASGQPVAGAQITSLWTINSSGVTTKKDGTFVLANDEPRLANLAFLATADGGKFQGIFRFQDSTRVKDGRTLVRIALKPARVVTVSVVDGRGKPVEGAAVCVLDLVFPVATARTDARGVATLSTPADGMTLWIFGYKAGVGFDYFENYRSAPPAGFAPPPERCRLVLDGTRTVRVRVVDSAGKPVPDIEMVPVMIFKKGKNRHINLSSLPIKVLTRADGLATFDWFPGDSQGSTQFFTTSSSCFLPRMPLFEPDKPDVELTARVVRFTRISGKVTHPDGSPAPGIRVVAEGAGNAYPAASGRARTGADGSYEIALPPEQSYMIYVSDDEWAARTLKGVVTREEKTQTGLDLKLDAPTVIMGRVSAGLDAQPAAGVAVMLVEHGPAVPPGTLKDQPDNLRENATRIADTNEDGRYAFRVGPGRYHLIGPREPSASPIPAPVAEKLNIAGGQLIERDFRLSVVARLGRTVRGIVRAKGPDGPPIAGAIVIGQSIDAHAPESHGSADERGRFELPRPFGRTLVYARSPQGDMAGYATTREDDDTEVTIVTSPATTARGRVVDSAGRPRAGVIVSWRMDLRVEGVDGPARAGQAAVTDADGRFVMPGLRPGASCKLVAHNPTGGNSRERRFAVKDTAAIDVGAIVLDSRGIGKGEPGGRSTPRP